MTKRGQMTHRGYRVHQPSHECSEEYLPSSPTLAIGHVPGRAIVGRGRGKNPAKGTGASPQATALQSGGAAPCPRFELNAARAARNSIRCRDGNRASRACPAGRVDEACLEQRTTDAACPRDEPVSPVAGVIYMQCSIGGAAATRRCALPLPAVYQVCHPDPSVTGWHALACIPGRQREHDAQTSVRDEGRREERLARRFLLPDAFRRSCGPAACGPADLRTSLQAYRNGSMQGLVHTNRTGIAASERERRSTDRPAQQGRHERTPGGLEPASRTADCGTD